MAIPPRRKALRKVLREVPCSGRRLADEAGLSHGNLLQVRDGARNLTNDSAEKLVEALRRWRDTCDELASELEATL